MRNKYFFIFTCFISFFLSSANAADPFQYESQVIESINIIIVAPSLESTFDAGAVKAKMKTRQGDLFSQNLFDADLKVLAHEFDRVEPVLERINGKLQVSLKIWPRPMIRNISWCGCKKISEGELKQELGITPRTPFNRLEFNKAFNKLKALYLKKGFFEAELNYTIIENPDCQSVDIEISISEGRSGRINEIVFSGFTCDEENAILDRMITKKYRFLISWFLEEGTYNEDVMQQDQIEIISFLQNEGYADAKVDIRICDVPRNQIKIIITADKGEKYFTGNISIKGNTLYPEETLRKLLVIKEGCPYSPEAIRASGKNFMDFYGRAGYIDAFVNYETTLSCDENVYDITISITEGERYRVGLIKVFGNTSTQTRVILHECLLVPGDVFNIIKLQKTEERLLNIGFFKAVNVYAVKSADACSLGANFRDVHIEVEEKTTGNVGAFFGFSTVEGIFGGINLVENNFNYMGLGFLGEEGLRALRGGGEHFQLNATIGSKGQSYGISWSKPYWKDTRWLIGFDITRASNHYIDKDYHIQSGGLNLRAGHQINSFWRQIYHYRIDNSWVHFTKHTPESAKKTARIDGLISAVGATYIYDSTNRVLFPTRGFKSKISTEIAGVGGDHTFVSLGYLNSYYFKLPKVDEKGVWRFRADFSFLLPFGATNLNSMPLDERLFLGGEFNLRGYRPYRLGPKFRKDNTSSGSSSASSAPSASGASAPSSNSSDQEVPSGDPDASDDPSGGLSLQLFSLEYSYPLFSRVDLFGFFDAGHLSEKEFHFGRLNASVGYGARIRLLDSTPPFTVGIGYPLNAKRSTDVKRFFFSIGGMF